MIYVFVTNGTFVFDYHGYSRKHIFLDHYFAKARRYFADWDAGLIPVEVSLISGQAHDIGLYILKPGDFLYNALPVTVDFCSGLITKFYYMRRGI